jgi:predicted RNA methylase
MYRLATKVSSIISVDKIHPKHQILKYKEWFSEHVKNNDVVLDIGSNTGELPVFLSNKIKHVYGIEIVEQLHKKALERDNISNVGFILGDATSYNYSKIRPISVVTLSNVLEHIEHRVEFLKGITENLSWEDEKNRKLLIRVPMMDRDWITIYKKNMGVEWRLDLTHYTEYTMDSFLQEMNEAGILVLESDVRFGEIYAVCSIKN